MYKLIGADGNEYGPVSADQLRQWIAEGRVNAQTKVLPEGATEWRPLSQVAEFAATTPTLPPPSMTSLSLPVTPALDQVNGPAIGLIVVAILQFLAAGFSLIWQLGLSTLALQQPSVPWANLLAGPIGVVWKISLMVLSVLILFGAIKMKKLETYGLAMTASIVAMLPCSLCCLAGLPIGIWSLVVLSRPEVKNAFH